MVLLSAAMLFLVGTFVGATRRQRREARQVTEALARLQESMTDAAADLTVKIDEVVAAQAQGRSGQAGGVRELSDLLEGQIARLAEVGEQWRSALAQSPGTRGAQTEMLAEHFDTQRRLIEGYADEMQRVGNVVETQISRLGDLGDAWVNSATSAESYQDRQVQVMGDYAGALKAMAIALGNIETAVRDRAGPAAAGDEPRVPAQAPAEDPPA